jgi:hypothetical protein
VEETRPVAVAIELRQAVELGEVLVLDDELDHHSAHTVETMPPRPGNVDQ